MSGEERGGQGAEDDEYVQLVAGDLVVEGGDVGAGCVGQGHPQPDPECGTEGVEGEEAAPGHAAGARDDAVDLAQSLDEAGDGDDLAAVAGEELLGRVEALRGQEHVAAPPVDE